MPADIPRLSAVWSGEPQTRARTWTGPEVQVSGPLRGWTGPSSWGPGPVVMWTGPWGRTRVRPEPDLMAVATSEHRCSTFNSHIHYHHNSTTTTRLPYNASATKHATTTQHEQHTKEWGKHRQSGWAYKVRLHLFCFFFLYSCFLSDYPFAWQRGGHMPSSSTSFCTRSTRTYPKWAGDSLLVGLFALFWRNG